MEILTVDWPGLVGSTLGLATPTLGVGLASVLLTGPWLCFLGPALAPEGTLEADAVAPPPVFDLTTFGALGPFLILGPEVEAVR
jgi:hypothetical protein